MVRILSYQTGLKKKTGRQPWKDVLGEVPKRKSLRKGKFQKLYRGGGKGGEEGKTG